MRYAQKTDMDLSKLDHVDMLAKAILSLENEDECLRLLEDLLTVTEIKALAQRIVVAKLLREKKSYNEIVSKTGASSATVSRVNRCLVYGDGGYETVLKRIGEDNE